MSSATTVRVVLLSGPSGIGKSTTAFETCAILRRHNAPHVHIDGDNMTAMYPIPQGREDELFLVNLEACVTNFWKFHRQWESEMTVTNAESSSSAINPDSFVFLISGTSMVLHRDKIEEMIRRVVGNDDMKLHLNSVDVQVHGVILQATGHVVDERLIRREIGSADELEVHLQSSRKMRKVLAGLQEKWLTRVDTDSKLICDIADEVVEVCLGRHTDTRRTMAYEDQKT